MTMRIKLFIILLIGIGLATCQLPSPKNSNLELATFLADVNKRLAELFNKKVETMWQSEIEGPQSLAALYKSELAAKDIMIYLQSISGIVGKYRKAAITDEYLKRELEQIPEIGYDALNEKEMDLMYQVTANMSDVYSNVKLCSYTDRKACDLPLMPDVQNILHSSQDINEIEYYWLEWRYKTGIRAREPFEKFVELYRKTAALNGFSKPSDFWFKDIEGNSTVTMAQLEKIMYGLRPLFQQFHAHIRAALRARYGPQIVEVGAPYPQNLAEIFIGNSYRDKNGAWAVKFPYPEIGMPNITLGLLNQGFNTPERQFTNAVEYFDSIGMPELPEFFWENNAKPKSPHNDRYMTCWHKAWKYYGGIERVNFSYCENIDEDRFLNMFEAVTDVYYSLAYKAQPTLFQEEPLPNFSDALGKVFTLAVSSPKYLERMGIIKTGYTTREARINRLYLQGLRTIFLIPVFYVLDRYRVELLDGKTSVFDNCAYWDLTETYTGADAPVKRSNGDFDAPAKLLMEVDDQYTSQVISIVLQFQLYKNFCERTGQYRKGDPDLPLDLCDLSGQTKIGPLVYQAMSLGSSKSYKEVLRTMTGETELDISGLLEYFQPLFIWLHGSNREGNVELGWKETRQCT